MSDKVVCSRCGLYEDYIDEEVIDPVEGLRHVTVLPPNWKRFVWGAPKFLCPECCNKLDAFFGIKPKNLAQELLLLASSKKEFDDNHTKKRFDEICESLKELAKSGKITTIITVPIPMKKEMLNLFKEHGFNVFILPSPPISDDVDFQISWEFSNFLGC